jgi:serine/threonine protein kinase
VIHRDLKPENILLQEGQPLIADFGIALAVAQAGGPRVTETGLSLGTPHYMSPEQAAAEREIDVRSDQYALAAVTYEMLSGEPPHTGPTAQAVIARLMTEPVRSLRATRPGVPVEVERVAPGMLLDVETLSRSPHVYKPIVLSDWRRPGRRVLTVVEGMIEWPRPTGAEARRWLGRTLRTAARRWALARRLRVDRTKRSLI